MRKLLWCPWICCALLAGCADNDGNGSTASNAAPAARNVADTSNQVVRGQDADANDAPESSSSEQGSPAPRALAYPTGDKSTSLLLIEANPPEKVMVGKEYQYEIKLTNLTKNLMLNQLEVSQELPESVELVKAEQPQKQQKKSGESSQQKSAKQPDKPEKQTEKSDQSSDSGSKSADKTWKVDQLKPGETAVIKVTAMGDQQGTFGQCIGVRYEPVLCVSTQFVKPELQLTKAAPEKADLCQAIVYRYTITNSGSGAAKNLTITDPLPEGFQTDEGKDQAEFKVDSLPAGKSQDFEVRVLASEAGEFSSRATAKGEGDLSANSSKPKTTVSAAELKIAADGPGVQQSGEPSTYQVTVTNSGQTKAQQVRLNAELAQNIRVLKTSDPYEEADLGLVWALGDLDPGQSKKLWIRLIGREPGEMTHKFSASSACARKREADLAKAEVSTEIISLPALALVTADAQDPVQVGEQATYDVAVVNEGTAPAKNVQVVAELPEQMKFVSASGSNDGKADGNEITFPVVKELAPGESLEWRIKAEVEKDGNSKLEVKLTSDMLKEPAISQEPTRLIGESTETRSASSASKEANEAKSKQR
jgi:uncharacterized repeat protein (TIGR01451 family)